MLFRTIILHEKVEIAIGLGAKNDKVYTVTVARKSCGITAPRMHSAVVVLKLLRDENGELHLHLFLGNSLKHANIHLERRRVHTSRSGHTISATRALTPHFKKLSARGILNFSF